VKKGKKEANKNENRKKSMKNKEIKRSLLWIVFCTKSLFHLTV